MTPAQCRAARHLLKWSQGDLAARTSVSAPTIWNFEHEKCEPKRGTFVAIGAALEEAGIEFLSESAVPGVRLRTEPYSIEHLVNVVRRFQRNFPSGSKWTSVRFEPLFTGFELWIFGKPRGMIIVIDDEPFFDPPLPKPRTRADGWVTEDELRYWVQSLRERL
jgi:transcriptional regulator with XRE-family HTH domain